MHLPKPLNYLHITKYNLKNCVSSIQEIENNQSDVDEPLYDGASVTVAQSLLLIMAFILGNNLSGAAVGNLLRLLAALLPADSDFPRQGIFFISILILLRMVFSLNCTAPFATLY